MESNQLSTEIILSNLNQSLGKLTLDWNPQPGNYLNFQGQTYAILERRHRYQFRSGRYKLDKISIYVQMATPPTEKSYIAGHWVIGDATCRFNAKSEIMRCAVNPTGPCNNCHHYESS